MTDLNIIGAAAKEAAFALANASTAQKDAALMAIAAALEARAADILSANREDVEAARAGGMSPSMLDRLSLSEARVKGMAEGVRDVAKLPDPVGRVLSGSTLACGLAMEKIAVPLGVIGIIFEARPNVTSDAAALCLKSGNACILRGGKEAIRSNTAIVAALHAGLAAAGLPAALVGLVQDTSRRSAGELMAARGLVDLLIPRGGRGLIRACVEQAKVPCIETGTGICHIYVDKAADLDMALAIVDNAKTSRPSVCNAAEVCLVHEAVAGRFLPMLARRMAEKHTQLRLCPRAAAVIPGTPAGPDDFDTEFLDYILAVRVVGSLEEAVAHIAAHSTGHSEAIVTADEAAAQAFCAAVDSAAVYVNASTRFTDGGELGLGAEIGISTQKLHARGPMGLLALTTTKYIIYGNGQIRP